jgi:hypothetical protein
MPVAAEKISTELGIMAPGCYKVKLRIADGKLFAKKHDGRTTLKYRTVERWFNDGKEAAHLFSRWAEDGIAAQLGRYVGT